MYECDTKCAIQILIVVFTIITISSMIDIKERSYGEIKHEVKNEKEVKIMILLPSLGRTFLVCGWRWRKAG